MTRPAVPPATAATAIMAPTMRRISVASTISAMKRDASPASTSSSSTPSGVAIRVRSSYCTGVNLERFESQRGGDWARLETLLRRAGGRRGRRRLGADGVLELGSLYRGAAADLAYARRRFPGDPVVARLEALVVAGRGAVYGQT